MNKNQYILILLFSCFSVLTYSQKNTDYKKSFGKEQIVDLNMYSGLSESEYLLIEVNQYELARLMKNEKVRVIKRLDKSHLIIKVIDLTYGQNIIDASKYVAVANDDWKLSERIRNPTKERQLGKNITVVGLTELNLNKYLNKNGFEDYNVRYAKGNTLILEVQLSKVLELLKSNAHITHIDFTTSEVTTEAVISDQDLSINRVNVVHSNNPQFNGSGLTVSVKEDVFDVLDIDLVGRSKVSGIESSTESQHASDMATIIGGAGNSFITGKGSAWGCNFTSSSFENIFPDDDNVFADQGISVQNHSYGVLLPDNRYNTEAMLYDVNTVDNPNLLHVFSAGNIGLETADAGTYKGINGYANLSGGFKMAKNILVIGALDRLGLVDERNSAGPAYDGRLKPELVAYGKNGTSEAAAIVSGVSLLMQDALAPQLGETPRSSLVKAILIAGADDAGGLGIDFITGYGSVNASRSMDIITNSNYYSDQVMDGEMLTFDISVPDNVKELKLALVWSDPAANVEDNIALVNDLDLKVTDKTTNEAWLPWVLDHSPNIAALSLPAIRKEDHLNNVELITVDAPGTGDYSLSIEGNAIIGSAQTFDVAYTWSFVDEFDWTYPSSKDVVLAGELNTLRWDSNVDVESDIELSINGGAWSPIIQKANLSLGFIDWQTENILAKAKLRLLIKGTYVESDEFSIAPVIEHEVGFDCADSFMLQWNKVEDVDEYNVYELGNRYLELVYQTTDTVFVFDKAKHRGSFFTISPVWANTEGNKSLAYDYQQQGVNCYYRNFLALNVEDDYVNLELNISTDYEVMELIFERSTIGGMFSSIATFIPQNGKVSYTYDDPTPVFGYNIYRARIVLEDNTEIIVDEITVFFPGVSTLIVLPNPVASGDFISIFSRGDQTLFQLIDLQGKVVRELVLNSNQEELDILLLQRGMYIYRMLDKDNKLSQGKLIVN